MENQKFALKMQRDEATSKGVYLWLAKSKVEGANKKILEKIAKDEERHYLLWKSITNQDVAGSWIWTIWFVLAAKILGVHFALKLLEKGEKNSQNSYRTFISKSKPFKQMLADEMLHEQNLVNMLKDGRAEYVSSMVLGINDALVELTGALAGLTLAFADQKIIAASGFVTGIAAALSMGASEYLSKKEELRSNNALRAASYTGLIYLITVLLLIFPFLILKSPYVSIAFTVCTAVVIIFLFTYYVATMRGQSFRQKFLEMLCISMTVTAVSFGMGLIAKLFFGLTV